VREFPHESELGAVKRQKRLAWASYTCIVLLGISLYLWDQGFSTRPAAWVVFSLLCLSLLARAACVFGDGFLARGVYITRGGYGIALALVRLGGELAAGLLLLLGHK
jgi:hypothetical protein